MTFPAIGTPVTTQTAPGSTTHSVALPASLTAGRILVLAVQSADLNVGLTGLEGWTERYENADGYVRGVYARIVDGTEGGTLVLSTTSATRISAVAFEVSGAYSPSLSSLVAAGVDYISSTNYPRASPDLESGWGSADTLWLSVFMGDSTGTLTTAPTDYAEVASVVPTSTSSSHIYVYSRELAAADEQPGDWTFATLRASSIVTLAVRPAGPASPTGHRFMMLGIG
jgi:hypothetical protein